LFESYSRRELNLSKFMQSLGDSAYNRLRKIADDRDITVQELIRAIVIPDWLKTSEKDNGGDMQREKRRRRLSRSRNESVVMSAISRPKRKH